MVRFFRPPGWRFPNYKGHLPNCYYKFTQELDKPSKRVHDVPVQGDLLDYKMDPETGRISRVRDVPIEVIYPKQADEGIWGGEGVVKGYQKLRKYFKESRPLSFIWFPNLYRAVFYSEILDKHLKIICTKRTLNLVDEAFGFDEYILRTPVQDLKSQLALHLRRFMLIKLAKGDFSDPEKGKELQEKFKDCIVSLKEAEWFGLTYAQAATKQKIFEAQKYQPVPMKVKFADELIQELRKMKESGELETTTPKKEEKTGWLRTLKSKLPFVKR